MVGQVPLPIGGLNFRDPYTDMPPSDLLVADNVVIKKDGAHSRPGTWTVVKGLDGAVQSLAEFQLPQTIGHLIAATPTSLYHILGINGPAVWIGANNQGLISTAVKSNTGGNYLGITNGVDPVRIWDGSNLTVPSIQICDDGGNPILGADPTQMDLITAHHTLWFFAIRGTLQIVWLDHDAIMGTGFWIDLAPFCQRGGSIVAMASSNPGGGRNTSNNLYVATSEGELIVFAGTYPENASTWSLVGVYDIGVPTGRRAFAEHGGTLYIATKDGIENVAQIISGARSEQEYAAITDKVRNLWYEVVASQSDFISFIDGGAIGFKVVTLPTGQQLIQESQTKAWSMFGDLNAYSFCESTGYLFAGCGDGTVKRFDSTSDDGTLIKCFIGHAYDAFKREERKKFSRTRLRFHGDSPVAAKVGLLMDYKIPPDQFVSQTPTGFYWLWYALNWPQTPTPWTTLPISNADQSWRGISGRGRAAAFMIAWQCVRPMIYRGADIMFETGGML